MDGCDAVDRLILLGALPDVRTFELPLIKLPPSFVHFHKGAALRHEGASLDLPRSPLISNDAQ